MKKNTNRIILIDEIRGFCIILMVIYHFIYDLSQNIQLKFFDNTISSILRDFFASIFIIICGISCNFSHNNLKRGFKCLSLGLLITLITNMVIPDQIIVFGILHMLGTCIIIYTLLSKFNYKLNKKLIILIFLILFFLTFEISNKKIAVPYIFSLSLPKSLYNSNITAPLGFAKSNFISSDYFPLLPWSFLFFMGTLLGSLKNKDNYPKFMYVSRNKFLKLIGENTLIIYLLHQPIFYLIFFIFNKL